MIRALDRNASNFFVKSIIELLRTSLTTLYPLSPSPLPPARIHYLEREEQRPCSSRLPAAGSVDASAASASPPSGVGISPHGSPQLQQRLGKHLSKSASELNGHDCHSNESPHLSPKRAKSAASQQLVSGSSSVVGVSSGAGVLQKTHGFFNNLRHRWSRAKSKDRIGRKSPSDFLEESTDYAADYSSESSSVTQSPRHRATTIGSPLARDFRATAKMAQVIQRFGGSMEGRIDEQPEHGNSHAPAVGASGATAQQQQLDALQVSSGAMLLLLLFGFKYLICLFQLDSVFCFTKNETIFKICLRFFRQKLDARNGNCR